MADDTTDHAVIISLALSDGEFGTEADEARVWELEDQLIEAIDDGQIGEYDGNEIGEGEAVLYLYGPDADSLFAVAEPILRAWRPRSGSAATKRYGSADDPDAREVTIALA